MTRSVRSSDAARLSGTASGDFSSPWKARARSASRCGAGARQAEGTQFRQPTAATTRWRVSVLPATPLPVPGIGRARWGFELIRRRGGDSATFEVEARGAESRLALACLEYRSTAATAARMGG